MSPHAQARVVLCGGIGSGKSSAGGIFAKAGATVIDADEAGHRVLDPGGAAFDEVAARWPDVVVDGVIDRAALGEIVFGDRPQLSELEAITHPAIRTAIAERLAESDADVVVVEIPLLGDFLGEGWRRVVVDAPDDIRTDRLLSRGMTPADVARRMAAQPARGEWLDAADLVIDNSGTLPELEAEVRRILGEIKRES